MRVGRISFSRGRAYLPKAESPTREAREASGINSGQYILTNLYFPENPVKGTGADGSRFTGDCLKQGPILPTCLFTPRTTVLSLPSSTCQTRPVAIYATC